MTAYEIIANGISLNTNEDINISINYQIEDILDISSRATNWSRSITLPGSATNNRFFKHIFDVNIDAGTFNPLKKVPVTVRIGDNQIFKGNLQLESISVIHELIEYEVSIYGELNNIMNQIKDAYVHELDISEFNHIRNQQNIVDSHIYKIVRNGASIQYDEPGIGYVYPYIIYGNDTSFASNVNIYDTFPAIYSTQLFKKIIEENGYKIKSNFLESEYAKKLILPYTSDKIQLSDEQIDNFGSVIGIPPGYIEATDVLNRGSNWQYVGNLPDWTRETGTVDDASGELTFKDNLNQFTAGTGPNIGGGGFWICQNQGFYDIDWRATGYVKYTHEDLQNIDYDEGSGSFEYIYDMWVIRAATGIHQQLSNSGGTQLFTPSSGDHLSPWIDTDVPLNFSLSNSAIQLFEGDAVYVRYGFRYPSTVNWSDELFDDKIHAQLLFDNQNGNEFSYFQVIPTSNVDMGNQMIDMNQCLPENYKQTDFIGDYVKMFNLIITEEKNDPSTLIIEPRDVYYSINNKILYWDNIFDEDNGYEITPMSEVDSNEYLFTYTEDADYFNTEYTDSTKRIYGDFKINVGNDFSDKTNTTKVTTSPTPDAIKFTNGKVAPYFIQKDDEGLKPMKVKNRFLFYGGLIPTDYLIIQDAPGQPIEDTTVLDYYPYCGMWDHPFEPEHDLGFGATDKIYWNSYQFPIRNLFNEFHKNTVNNLINPNARLFEGKFLLHPKDIAQFDFRNVVFLKGAYWRVNEIKNYDPTANDKLTTVVLYKILDVYTTDKVTAVLPPTNYSCPVDMITKKVGKKFVHVSKSGLPVSENCCSSLGGDYINGICYLGDYNTPVLGPVRDVLVPTPEPEGPTTAFVNGNSVSSVGVKVHGRQTIVGPGVDNTNISIGKNQTITPKAKNSLTIGDYQIADKENVINLNGTIISDNGTITPNFNMLRGPRDTVRNLFPYNPFWNKWKSGTDSVRDVDFMSEINMIQGKRDAV